MAPEAATYLWDALKAARLAMQFVQGRSFDDYGGDAMLRSAVERQLEIVGEALNQLRKLDPETAGTFPELAQAVGLRNILIHGYASVNDRLVWDVASGHLPRLALRLEQRLANTPP
ncbi:hypothetical protein X805_25220 [Sphaerotilus natans subsp. natans DSM 6575]|uniref:DUF86 domain-containing protein n=1 Tax=Sphaerotilus natans subsp. natans DSM 6575 TaxID=1286631 RepID=A0A059KKH6_9BURK|nr:DUF86 domain-containing protein [Sphaerotilus natans]KDB51880.1 hypothetical protein X805_25220 [Sphaerotilus natans subsp. natans DSM 6575]SIQ19446.1 Uncharacterized conserved protein, contains HEPN domain [Sphaerotilus natans]